MIYRKRPRRLLQNILKWGVQADWFAVQEGFNDTFTSATGKVLMQGTAGAWAYILSDLNDDLSKKTSTTFTKQQSLGNILKWGVQADWFAVQEGFNDTFTSASGK